MATTNNLALLGLGSSHRVMSRGDAETLSGSNRRARRTRGLMSRPDITSTSTKSKENPAIAYTKMINEIRSNRNNG